MPSTLCFLPWQVIWYTALSPALSFCGSTAPISESCYPFRAQRRTKLSRGQTQELRLRRCGCPRSTSAFAFLKLRKEAFTCSGANASLRCVIIAARLAKAAAWEADAHKANSCLTPFLHMQFQDRVLRRPRWVQNSGSCRGADPRAQE